MMATYFKQCPDCICPCHDDCLVPVEGVLIEHPDQLRQLVETLAVLEVVPWTANPDETAGVMAHRLAVRVLLELANPGDGYDGAKVRTAVGGEETP
jgi:hypothetical protein